MFFSALNCSSSTEIVVSFMQYIFQAKHYSLELFAVMLEDLFAMFICFLQIMRLLIPLAAQIFSTLDKQVNQPKMKKRLGNKLFRKLQAEVKEFEIKAKL